MTEQKQTPQEKKDAAVETVVETPTIPQAVETPAAVAETKTEEKKTATKESKPAPKVRREDAMARGISLSISKKHSMALCKFIKNKSIDAALADLEEVLKFKKAVPFKGEIPHRHGDMMSVRYPLNAARVFITVLKGLKGNALANGMNLESTRIVSGSASWASRPHRKDGARFKRTHLTLCAKEIKQEKKK